MTATAIKPSLHLYEATEALNIVGDLLYESEGQVTPEIEELLEQAEGQFAEKAERVALFIRGQQSQAKLIKEEEERLAERRKRYDRSAESLKAYLQRNLEAAGKEKVEGKFISVRIQKNPPAVKGEFSQALLGMLYQKSPAFVAVVPQSYTLDKNAIKDAFKRGEVLPEGIEIQQSISLRIA